MEGEQHLSDQPEQHDPADSKASQLPLQPAELQFDFVGLEEGLQLLGAIDIQIKKLQEQRLETIRELRFAGATWPHIATALGEKVGTVYQRWAHRI